jgi:exosortase
MDVVAAAEPVSRTLKSAGHRRSHVVLVILVSFAPLLILHFMQLWAFEHYGFFPLLLAAIPFLVWQLRCRPAAPTNTSILWEKLCMGFGFVLLLLAIIAWSPNLAAVAAITTAGGALQHFSRVGRIRRPFAIWLLLLLLIKLPLNIDLDLIFWLQGWNSRIASRMLDFVSVSHVLQGHVIRVPGNGFMVEDACSGIQSLFTLIATAGIALVLVHRSRLHSLLLISFAAFWACMINTLRIASVVLASVWFDIDISSGFSHELLGIILFGVAIWMLMCSDSLLQLVLGTSRQLAVASNQQQLNSESTSPLINSTMSEVSSGRGWRSTALAGAFAILGVAQLGVMTLSSRGAASINPDDPRLQTAFSESTLPEQLGELKRTVFQKDSRTLTDYMGRNTASWTYESEDKNVVVAVDYPFLGWHELTGCYEAQGCGISERTVLPETNGVRTVTCEVRSTGDLKGQLWFSEFLESGEPLVPLGSNASTGEYWLSRIQSSFLRQSAAVSSNPSNYQVQLLVHSRQAFTESEHAELLALHRETAGQIVKAIREATQ